MSRSIRLHASTHGVTALFAKVLGRCHADIPWASYKAFVSLIETKQCANKKQGHVLFLIEDVNVGGSLFYEQAFSAVLLQINARGTSAITSGGMKPDSNEFSLDEARYALSFDRNEKLQDDPSLAVAIWTYIQVPTTLPFVTKANKVQFLICK